MAMINIQCSNCERVVKYDEEDFEYGVSCGDCGHLFCKVEDDEEDHEIVEESPHKNNIKNLPEFDPDKKTRFD